MIALAIIAAGVILISYTSFYENRLLKDTVKPRTEVKVQTTLFRAGMVLLLLVAALGSMYGGSLIEKKITEEQGVQRVYVQNQSNYSKAQAFRSFHATLPKDTVPEDAFVEQLEKQDSKDYQHEYLPIEEIAEYEINEQFTQDQFSFEAVN